MWPDPVRPAPRAKSIPRLQAGHGGTTEPFEVGQQIALAPQAQVEQEGTMRVARQRNKLDGMPRARERERKERRA